MQVQEVICVNNLIIHLNVDLYYSFVSKIYVVTDVQLLNMSEVFDCNTNSHRKSVSTVLDKVIFLQNKVEFSIETIIPEPNENIILNISICK